MKTIIINNAGPRGPVGPQGVTGPSGSDANVPPLIISSSKQFTNITSPFTGSFTGSFAGDGSNLINVPASGVVGLNLSRISSGTATASISETGGLFVNTHITASGDISASNGTITALTGSFNHIITDDETLEFRSKTAGTKIGQLKFSLTNGLDVQDSAGARAKIRAARGEFLSLEAGPLGMNSLGSITASGNISASGRFIGDGSGLTNVFENTAASSSLSTRVTANESAISTLDSSGLLSGSAQIASSISGSFGAPSASFSTRISANEIIVAKTLISGSSQIASSISGSFGAPSASFSTRVTTNETNISDNKSLITGITSSLSTTGRMVFVGASGILTSEAGFEYNATTNQLSVDNLNVNHLTSSFITASRIFTSGSNIFGDASTDIQTLIGTTKMSGSAQVTGSLNISGIITGNGSGLTDIPASGITGLNLSQIASGSATASISPDKGFQVNTDTQITGSLTISGSILIPDSGSNITIDSGSLNVKSSVASANIATFTPVNSAGRVEINDAEVKVTETQYGYTGARLYSTINRTGEFSLHYWAGNTGVYFNGNATEGGNSWQQNFIGGGLHVGGAKSPSSNYVPFAFSVRGPSQLSGSLLVSGSVDIEEGFNISGSATSTASFGTYLGDGSQLDGVQAFPFSGDAVITGSLTVSGSVVDFMSASAINLDIEKIPLVNPMVEYFDVGAITGSGTTITLPNSLTYVSSSVYEYLEVFVNGLRLRYNRDFIPMSDTSIKYNITIVSGSEVTYKSIKRP